MNTPDRPQPPPPRTTIVLTSWRTPDLTGGLLLYLQTAFPRHAIIVVTCDGDRLEHVPLNANVRVMARRNLGYAGGNNVGIRAALENDPQSILVLNSDTFPLPGAITALERELARGDDVGVVGGVLQRHGDDGALEFNMGHTISWKSGRTRPWRPESGIPVDYPCGAMLLFSTAALQRVGLLDAGLFLFSEEIDWCERARALGYRMAVAVEARSIHLGSASVKRAPRAVAYYGVRNSIIVRRRYGHLRRQPVRAWHEHLRVVRVVGGHVRHGRLRLVYPVVKGARDGWAADLRVRTDEATAVAQQRWETRDPSHHGEISHSGKGPP